MQADDWDQLLSRIFGRPSGGARDERALSRLKARVYSAPVHALQEMGPLQTLTQSQADGRGLRVFEKLVQNAPIGEAAKAPFFRWVCHSRILAEHIE